jgi:hypothetical protein
VVVNLVSESCRAFAIVPFEAPKGKRTAVGEDYPPPNSLQGFLTISNVRIIYSHKGTARRNEDVLATDGVINVFPHQRPDQTRQIGVQLLLEHRRNKPPSFDLILAKGRISLSAEVFRFFLMRPNPKGSMSDLACTRQSIYPNARGEGKDETCRN